MKRYMIASVLALSLAGFATGARAEGDMDDLNQLLASLEQVRAQMYTMARSDKSMMVGVKKVDQMISMVKKRMVRAKRRGR